MTTYKTCCPKCGALMDADPNKPVQQCPYCDNAFSLNPAEQQSPALDKGPVVAICHDCGGNIHSNEKRFTYEKKVLVRSGRTSHWESETYPLCEKCYDKQIAADKAEERRIAEAKAKEKRRERNFRLLIIIIAIIATIAVSCFFGYCATTVGMSFISGFLTGLVICIIAIVVLIFKVLI